MECSNCHEDKFLNRNGLCKRCTLTTSAYHLARTRTWSEEEDLAIRRAYVSSTKHALSIELRNISTRFNIPVRKLSRRAWDLGCTILHRNDWTEKDLQYLRDHAGEQSLRRLSINLGRSIDAVKVRASQLGLRLRLTDGYSKRDLVMLFAVSQHTVDYWFRKGWIKFNLDNRVEETDIIRFLKRHPEEWSMRKVDEAWVKGLLFEAFGTNSRKSGTVNEIRCESISYDAPSEGMSSSF